ncbi:hypothetical protein ABT352_03830 [Streptosporangium sp. NPDC000563]
MSFVGGVRQTLHDRNVLRDLRLGRQPHDRVVFDATDLIFDNPD